LVPLICLISLAKECVGSLEVVRSWEHVKNALIESSHSSVRVVGMEYVIYQNFGPCSGDGLILEIGIHLQSRRG